MMASRDYQVLPEQKSDSPAFLNTTFLFNYALNYERPLLWPGGRSFSLRFQRSGFDSRRYQIFWEVLSLERGSLSLVSTIEELLGRKSNGSCLGNRDYCRSYPSRWRRGNLCPQKVVLTSPTSGGRSVYIFLSRTKATELITQLWRAFFTYRISVRIIRRFD
jgi:hypothetical protein